MTPTINSFGYGKAAEKICLFPTCVSKMIQWMKHGNHLINKSNLDSYIKPIRVIAEKYLLKEIDGALMGKPSFASKKAQ